MNLSTTTPETEAHIIVDGEQFIAYDDEPRWIGAAWPTADWVQVKERVAAYVAKRLADAVLDGVEGFDLECRRRDYEQARATARHVRDVYERLYVIAPTATERTGWEFPGAIVRA